jgi:lysophospholipase L1-like esterase
VLAGALLVLCAGAAWSADAAAPATPAPVRVLVVGDSLAVGMRPYLGAMLVGSDVTWDARSGRTTPQGLERLRARLRRLAPDAVLISLGTNDGPDGPRFADRINRALQAIPSTACVIWADVNRPARKGPYGALNRVLRAAGRNDGRVAILSWNRAVVDHRVVLPDHLHPDAAGFQYRAQMYADAVGRSCAVPDASGGVGPG